MRENRRRRRTTGCRDYPALFKFASPLSDSWSTKSSANRRFLIGQSPAAPHAAASRVCAKRPGYPARVAKDCIYACHSEDYADKAWLAQINSKTKDYGSRLQLALIISSSCWPWRDMCCSPSPLVRERRGREGAEQHRWCKFIQYGNY